MIARWKDFTISIVGLISRFTTNDDIWLGRVNEAPNFFFPRTNTLRVYCHNSKVDGFGLDWLHILRWWWRKQWCWKRSAAWRFFTASIVMSESSITESNKVAEKFERPHLGHSQGHEHIYNSMRRLASMLTQKEWYHILNDSQRIFDISPL